MVPCHLAKLKPQKQKVCALYSTPHSESLVKDGWMDGQQIGEVSDGLPLPPLLPQVPCHALWNKKENSGRTYVSLVIRLLMPIPWSWNTREKNFPQTPLSTSFIQLLLKLQWLGHHLGQTSQDSGAQNWLTMPLVVITTLTIRCSWSIYSLQMGGCLCNRDHLI